MSAYRCVNVHGVRIATGNSKLGPIPNVSLPPVITCPPAIPCARDCYAIKFARMYTTVDNAWTDNLRVLRDDSQVYFGAIVAYLETRQPKYFRWHVSGDIVNQAYLDNMVRIAQYYPDVRFLAFTKRFELSYRDIPQNLSIVFSAWPGRSIRRRRQGKGAIPIAWLQDGTETRIPSDAIECPGGCDSCGMCWSLAEIGRDVYFHKH